MPNRPPRDSHASRSFCHCAKVRISAAAALSSISPTYDQSSSTIRPSRSNRRGIHPFLEWFHAETAHRIDKSLIRTPLLTIYLEETRNVFRGLNLGPRGADAPPQGGFGPRRTADGDLIPLLAALVDAENA